MSPPFNLYPPEWEHFIQNNILFDGKPIAGHGAEAAREDFLKNFQHLAAWMQTYAVRHGMSFNLHCEGLDPPGAVYYYGKKSIDFSPDYHQVGYVLRHELFHGIHDLTMRQRVGVGLPNYERGLRDAVAWREAEAGRVAGSTVIIDENGRYGTPDMPIREYLQRHADLYGNDGERYLEYIAIMGDLFSKTESLLRAQYPNEPDQNIYDEIDRRIGIDVAQGGYGHANDRATPYGWFRHNVIDIALAEAHRLQIDADRAYAAQYKADGRRESMRQSISETCHVGMHSSRLNWEAALNNSGGINVRTSIHGLSDANIAELMDDLTRRGYSPLVTESASLGTVIRITGNDEVLGRFAHELIAGGGYLTVADEGVQKRIVAAAAQQAAVMAHGGGPQRGGSRIHADHREHLSAV